jgi:hypothetical protein
MRVIAFTIVFAGLCIAPSAAQPSDTKPFWHRVQKVCDRTADTTPNEIATRIAQTALDEHYRFGGHQIDANGRLFRFGLVEAEQEESDGDDDEARLGDLGWWQVLKYWRALHGSNSRVATRLRVWGYEEASVSRNDDKPEAAGGDRAPLHDETAVADAIKIPAADLIKLGRHADDEDTAEVLREAAFRAAIIDNPWSAAFISYVVKIAALGDAPNLPHVQDFSKTRFQFSSAHRHYIFAAFKTSVADAAISQKAPGDAHFYRACPLSTTNRGSAISSAIIGRNRWRTPLKARCGSAFCRKPMLDKPRRRSAAIIATSSCTSTARRRKCTSSAATCSSR